MKRINNLKQLQNEKARIKQQEQELKTDIQKNWAELKQCLKPANIGMELMADLFKKIRYYKAKVL